MIHEVSKCIALTGTTLLINNSNITIGIRNHIESLEIIFNVINMLIGSSIQERGYQHKAIETANSKQFHFGWKLKLSCLIHGLLLLKQAIMKMKLDITSSQ